MAQGPRLKRLAKEDYPEAPDWWGRFLDSLNPFLGDTTEALSQQLDRQNSSIQTEKVRVQTGANPTDYFTSGQLQIKNKLGRQPVEVRISQISVAATPAYVPGTRVYPALENSWANYQSTDGNYEAPGYYQDTDGTVNLFGIAKNGTIAQTASGSIFTLPAQMWPLKRHLFMTTANNAPARCDVWENGKVIAYWGSNAWYCLDGISFRPDTAAIPAVAAPYAAGSRPYTVLAPLGPAAWEATQSGTVRINNIAGLAPNTKYDITITLE